MVSMTTPGFLLSVAGVMGVPFSEIEDSGKDDIFFFFLHFFLSFFDVERE